jgi:hypothetical protein
MMRNIKSKYFVNTKDEMHSHRSFSKFFDEMKLKSFFEMKRCFCSSVFEIEIDIIFVFEIEGCDCYFDLRASEVAESQMFLYHESKIDIESENDKENENENEKERESIGSEKEEIGELLKLSGGSRIEGFSNFSGRKSTDVIRIEDSLEIVRE